MIRRFRNYLRPDTKKVCLWFGFVSFYILVWIAISPGSPAWLTSALRYFVYWGSVLSTPESSGVSTEAWSAGSEAYSPFVLFVSYLVTTYLWSCIFVESFDTIRGSKHRRSHKRGTPLNRKTTPARR